MLTNILVNPAGRSNLVVLRLAGFKFVWHGRFILFKRRHFYVSISTVERFPEVWKRVNLPNSAVKTPYSSPVSKLWALGWWFSAITIPR